MNKHTPGPWELIEHASGGYSIPLTKCFTKILLDDYSEIPKNELKANAKLIAAAPDMYKELRILLVELITWLEDEETGKHVAIDMLARLQSVKSMLDKLEVSGG